MKKKTEMKKRTEREPKPGDVYCIDQSFYGVSTLYVTGRAGTDAEGNKLYSVLGTIVSSSVGKMFFQPEKTVCLDTMSAERIRAGGHSQLISEVPCR